MSIVEVGGTGNRKYIMIMRTSRRTRYSLLAAGGGLALALVGCGGGDQAAPSSDQPSSAASRTDGGSSTARSPSASKSSKPPQRTADEQRLVVAGTTALKEVGRGTVTSIDLERDEMIWEVKVVTSGGDEHEVNVSRDGTKVASGPRGEHEDAEDKAENRQEVRGAELDYKAAAKKVLAARSGRLTELNLDDHRGKIVWEADVHKGGTKYEVKIDAASGKVLKNGADRGDDDDD